jgi:hypothetical protein
MSPDDQHQDQDVTAATLRGIEARWVAAIRASDWQFAHVAAEEAALAGMPELAAALHRETDRIAVERIDAIIEEAGRESGAVYDELEATHKRTGISESDAYDRARAVYCQRRGKLANDHGVDVADIIAREDELAEIMSPWPAPEHVNVDQADEQQPTTIPDDVYERACDDVLSVLAGQFGGGSIADDTRLARCLDAGLTTAYVLGLRDAYREAAKKAAEMQRGGDPLAALIQLGQQFALYAQLDERRAGGEQS